MRFSSKQVYDKLIKGKKQRFARLFQWKKGSETITVIYIRRRAVYHQQNSINTSEKTRKSHNFD